MNKKQAVHKIVNHRHREIRESPLPQSNRGVFVLAAFLLIALAFFIFLTNSIGSQQEAINSPKPTPFKKQKVVATPTPNLDPVIDCPYPVECGGTIKAKNSICANTTCCKIADRAFITGQGQCAEAVNKYNEAVRKNNENMDKIIQEYDEKMESIKEDYKNNYPTFSPQPMPTYNPPQTYIAPSIEPQPKNNLTDEQMKIKKDLLQLEIDQCKADVIANKNKSLQVCYASPEGTWQEKCVSDAISTYESALLICKYRYDSGIQELEK